MLADVHELGKGVIASYQSTATTRREVQRIQEANPAVIKLITEGENALRRDAKPKLQFQVEATDDIWCWDFCDLPNYFNDNGVIATGVVLKLIDVKHGVTLQVKVLLKREEDEEGNILPRTFTEEVPWPRGLLEGSFQRQLHRFAKRFNGKYNKKNRRTIRKAIEKPEILPTTTLYEKDLQAYLEDRDEMPRLRRIRGESKPQASRAAAYSSFVNPRPCPMIRRLFYLPLNKHEDWVVLDDFGFNFARGGEEHFIPVVDTVDELPDLYERWMNVGLAKRKVHLYAVELEIGWVGEIYLEDRWYSIAPRSQYPFSHFDDDRQFDITIARLKEQQAQLKDATLTEFLKQFGALPIRLNTTYSGQYIQQAVSVDQDEGNQSQEELSNRPRCSHHPHKPAARVHNRLQDLLLLTRMKWTGPICSNKRAEVLHADTGQEVFFCYGRIPEYLIELDVVAQKREICTVIAQGGTGKSALFQYWRDRGSKFLRPTNILIVPLVPWKDSYKSATHMLYACILDAIQKHSPPAYVPRRLLRRYDRDYLGRKNIEAMRKDVEARLTSPLVAIVFDGVEHMDKPAFHAALGFLGRYALIFSGQPRNTRDDKQLRVWLASITAANQAWKQAIELQRPTWQELRGTKEQRGLIRELLDDHVCAIVPPNEQRELVNLRLGKLFSATNRDWGSITRLVTLIDNYAEAQAGLELRHITHRTIDRIIDKLRLIDPATVQAVEEEDLRNTPQQIKQSDEDKHQSSVISLDEEQRAALEKIRDTHDKSAVRERAAAVLLFAAGKSLAEIAESYLKPKNPETIRTWIARYRTEGIKGLETRPGQGRKPRDADENKAIDVPK